MADDLGILGGHVAGKSVSKQRIEELRKFRLRHFKVGQEIVNPVTGDVGVVQKNGDLFIKWSATNRGAHGGSVKLGVTPVTVEKRTGPEPAPYGKPGTPESMAKAKKDIEDFRKGIR